MDNKTDTTGARKGCKNLPGQLSFFPPEVAKTAEMNNEQKLVPYRLFTSNKQLKTT
jgi:hypothetical protein